MVLGISRIKSLPTAAGLRVLQQFCCCRWFQQLERPLEMTSWPDRSAAARQAAGGPGLRGGGGVKHCQVIKGGRYAGKYDKRSNLHACLTTSQTANVLCGTDQVAPLRNSIILAELSQIPLACRGMIPNFPLRRSTPLTLHFTGLDGLWQILKLFITEIPNVSDPPHPPPQPQPPLRCCLGVQMFPTVPLSLRILRSMATVWEVASE